LHYAADHGADVASMSFGLANMSSDPGTDAALQYAYDHGVVLVAAVGNENASQIIYPANNLLVIAVGAASPCGERKRSSSDPAEVDVGVNTDSHGYTCDGERWWGSNYSLNSGQDMPGAVDVMGPVILPSTDITGSGGWDVGDYYQYFSGTSCATPYVAGVCALMRSHLTGLPPDAVRTQLCMTAMDMSDWVEATPGWDVYTGYGLVNAAAAVDVSAVSADFGAAPTYTCPGQPVAFSDSSVSYAWPVAQWQWDFGDGEMSAEQNPLHAYQQPGTYTVVLTVMAPDVMNYQWFDVELDSALVTVDEPVHAVAVASPGAGPVPLTVQFSDSSLGDPVTWQWDFGDGQTSTAQSPQHTYTVAGHYAVTLTVADPCASETTPQPLDIYAGVPTGAGDVVSRRFALSPNHPDPFNPATTLEFSLAQAGHATLEVFDVAGRRVATLVDADLEAGTHRADWRPQRMRSGVYFARLSAGGRTAVERMVLIQ